MTPRRIAVAPSTPWIEEAVQAGGGVVVDPGRAEALVWTTHNDAEALDAFLHAYPDIRWIQLPWAGVEPYLSLMSDGRVWSSAKGAFAEPVAEHARRCCSWPDSAMWRLSRVPVVGVGLRAVTFTTPR